jgi:hypothetical protein
MYTHPLLHSAKARCLVALVVTPWGPDVKRLPLHTLRSSRITSHYLSVILLAPGEKKKIKCEESRRERIRDKTSVAVLYSMHWRRLRR